MAKTDSAGEVAAIARIAGFELQPDRCSRISRMLEQFLQTAARLRAVDLEGVEPATPFRSDQGDA